MTDRETLRRLVLFRRWLRSAEFRASMAETNEIITRLEAASANPDDPKSLVWLNSIDPVTPRISANFWRYLPDPLKRKGRPKGKGTIISDEDLFAEIERRVDQGQKPTTAVRQILRDRGEGFYTVGEKSRVDQIVKAYRKRGK